MRLRAEYRVGPDLKFLANLDMMHLMERALRRARIPYLLTEGFNPHIRLSMGTILPVGLWGEKEYFDLEMDNMPGEDFMIRMNDVLPPNMRIRQCQEIKAGTPSLMKVVNAAAYAFMIKKNGLELGSVIAEILGQEESLVRSRGKNKSVLKDLRPGIHNLTVESKDEADIITALVSVNEPLNVRFDEVLELFANNGVEKGLILDFWRRGNYIKNGENFYSPLELI